MIISLCYEEYSPYLKGRIVKSDTVNSLTINTRSVKKYPYSFSIPPMYPPTIQTQQGRVIVEAFILSENRLEAPLFVLFQPEVEFPRTS